MASNVDFQEETEEEAMKLATVLGSVVPDEMFLLRAACYVESCDPRTQEPIPAVPFGIAYDLPKGYCKPKQLTQLWEMVDGTKVKHPLNERFELARQISTAVLFIHSVGWFHKGIRSSNIWLAQKDSSGRCFPQCLGTAFLAGLDYSRRGQATSTGDETGESWRRTIYQHPERASEAEASDCTAAPYRAEYDIYSLGVVLVELGRWKPVTSYDTMFKNVQAAKRKTNLESLADSLAITLGQRYVDVTLQCLRVLDSTSSSHISLGSPIRHAVLELEHLAAATR
ncbi:hypothetical protein H2203_001691 [Taxawa tesnikishii (nom. ined.)]|nr:hypothetical protein H2203_001691 [Dothideales sp. JES 119]